MNRITLEKAKRVEELLGKDLSLREIAGAVGVSHESVRKIKKLWITKVLTNNVT